MSLKVLGENASYVALTLALSVAILLVSYRFLRSWERQRRERLTDKNNMRVPVSTSSPVQNPLKKAREDAVRSVESRFTIIRRLITLTFASIAIFVIALPFIGTIPTAMISLAVAASSVIMGISAKPFLENFIAGIVMTFSRPFRTGDTVLIDDKYYGTVEDISMTYTIIKSWDWKRYVVPNSKMMNKEFVNLTLKDSYIWSYVEFWVAPDADLNLVREKAMVSAEKSEAYNDCEPPSFWVLEMGEKGIRCWVAAWADSPAEAWELSSDIRIELSRQLRILRIAPHRFTLDINSMAYADTLVQHTQTSSIPS